MPTTIPSVKSVLAYPFRKSLSNLLIFPKFKPFLHYFAVKIYFNTEVKFPKYKALFYSVKLCCQEMTE